MTKFNLKKKKAREVNFFNKKNILSNLGNDLINNKVDFINKNLDQVLFLDESLLNKNNKIINYEQKNFENIDLIKSYDCILSNFGLHIPLTLNMDINLNIINNQLNEDGLFCFNLVTINSMNTLRKIFSEIDDIIFNGTYNRFGPYHEVPSIIDGLNKNKFKDIVVSTEFVEFNYETLNKLRLDFKEFGIINIHNEIHKFNREFYYKTNSIFEKIIQKYKYIPVEIEIATFTSWK